MRKQRKLVIAAALAACALVTRSSYAVEPFTLVHDAYPEPVIEDGVTAHDMIRFEMPL